MKIKFDANGDNYVEMMSSQKDGHIMIVISARDAKNLSKTIVNSVEITREELNDMIKDLDSSSLPKEPAI